MKQGRQQAMITECLEPSPNKHIRQEYWKILFLNRTKLTESKSNQAIVLNDKDLKNTWFLKIERVTIFIGFATVQDSERRVPTQHKKIQKRKKENNTTYNFIIKLGVRNKIQSTSHN